MDPLQQTDSLDGLSAVVREAERERSTFQMPTGYCNTFTTHALPNDPQAKPPTYSASEKEVADRRLDIRRDVLPKYTCSVRHLGVVGVRTEMSTPFVQNTDPQWHDVYAILSGTQLSLYKLKTVGIFSIKEPIPNMSKLIKSWTLQHAEVGLALDHRPEELVPRSSIAKMTPMSLRARLYQTDPLLFEPAREWTFRLRAETDQLLFSTYSQEEMLTWVEMLSQSIDIAPPLDDRTEPKYRSVPRRNRRQRRIEQMASGSATQSRRTENATQRLVDQQERLFRRLYPHLAAAADAVNANANQEQGAAPEAGEVEEDNDPAGLRETNDQSPPLSPSPQDSLSRIASREARSIRSTSTGEAYDPKTAVQAERSASSLLRFRRRCAPILLLESPRCSDVIIHNGRRVRIDVDDLCLLPFELDPPPYDEQTRPAALASADPVGLDVRRPSLMRNISELSTFSTDSYVSVSATTDSYVAVDLDDVISASPADSPPASPVEKLVLRKQASVLTLQTTRPETAIARPFTTSADTASLFEGSRFRSFKEKFSRRRKAAVFDDVNATRSRSSLFVQA